MNNDITLSDVQRQADEWIKTYGVRYFNELTNMAILTEEVGELARVMARRYGDQSFKAGEKDNLEDEDYTVYYNDDGDTGIKEMLSYPATLRLFSSA